MLIVAEWCKNWAEQKKYPYTFYKSTTSTNDQAKENFNKQTSPSLLIAAFQTKGRGRKKKKWINSDMMLSWSYLMNKPPQPVTTEIMGLALLLSLKRSWPNCSFDIKYPNDIYISKKKLAGLLVEVVNKGNKNLLIIGVGMNVLSNPSPFLFTHLQEHVNTTITEKEWMLFMNEWESQILQKLPLCLQEKYSTEK